MCARKNDLKPEEILTALRRAAAIDDPWSQAVEKWRTSISDDPAHLKGVVQGPGPSDVSAPLPTLLSLPARLG